MFTRSWWSAGAVVLAAACGSSNGSGGDGSGGPSDSGTQDVATGDAGGGDGPTADAAGDGAVPYPAFMPAMPQIQKGSLPVIAAPVVVAVYFSGETLQTDLDSALSTYLASSEFAPASEYGVTSATSGTSIVLTETADTMPTSATIESWLDGKLDGTNAAFGPVDATTLTSKIFVLYYPSTTTITYGKNQSCSGFAGYHAGATLPSGAVANYVVIPRCPPGTAVTQVQLLTETLSALVVSAATNPIPSLSSTMTGWETFDTAHAAFTLYGGETGTACDYAAPFLYPDGTLVARIWSNAAARGYHNPCLPAPAGAYLYTVPVLTDMVTVPGTMTMTPGVLVPMGSSKTIDVQVLSDGPTTAPWTVATSSGYGTGFKYAFDDMSVKNGDTRKLTITSPDGPTEDLLIITSGANATVHSEWLVAVQSM
jgi:hypothetical protein